MARTGRFGRAPRTAPSLTSTIVSIARQFQQQRDSNIMDAWQKGGTFEGQKATDDKVLGYWRQRVTEVDPNDPLHDTYQNAVTQLDYSINESKMTAAYATKKKTDAQMVQFYLGWAKKVPKDSEFYRVLQRDAGQYMRNAQAQSEADKRRAEETRYQNQQAATRASKEAAGEFMIDTMRRIAQSGYANGRIGPAISGPGSNSDLTDFDPSDPETMLRLLDAIIPMKGTATENMPGGQKYSYAPNGDAIYFDDDKKPVTGADIVKKLQTLDPHYKPGGPLDVSYVTGVLDQQMQGINERIDRATKTGHMQDVVSLEKSKTYIATLNRQVGAYPVQKAYLDLRETYDKVAGDPTASPMAVMAARQAYTSGLVGLSNDPRIVADSATRARLIAEVNGDSGVPTLKESFTGMSNSQFDAGSSSDAATQKAHIEFLNQQITDVASGKAVWATGKTDANGVFVPAAGGTEIGSASIDAVKAGGANMQFVTVPDPRGGNPIQMAVTATPVYATATDPRTGKPLAATNSDPVAYAYDFVKGGKVTTQYGFQTKQGFVFSADPPWDASLKTTNSSKGGNHIEVDLSPIVQKMYGAKDPVTGVWSGTGPNLKQNTDLGNGWVVQGARTSARGATEGELTFNPLVAVTATSTRNALGQVDPQTDFHSLTLSNLLQDADGRMTLSNIDKNPAFKQQLEDDAYSYAGYQRDLRTGQWMPGAQADPSKLNAALNQNSVASFVSDLGKWLVESQKSWSRDTTGSPFPGGQSSSVPGPSGGFTPADKFGTVQPLASDAVRGTQFAVLGDRFMPGTSNIKPPSVADMGGGMVINTGAAIKVPAYTPPVVTGNATTQPVPAPTVTQTGSVAPTQTGSQGPSGYGSNAGYNIKQDYRPGAR